MPLKIVDADIKVLRNTARKGRARSPEILQLVGVLEALKYGQAKALVPEGKETTATLRVRLSTASKAAGVKVRTAIIDGKVVFALKARRGAGRNKGEAANRKKLIQDAAVKLAKGGRKAVSVEDILAAIKKAGAELNVARPATAVGAVLRRMPSFKRVGKNKFEYRG